MDEKIKSILQDQTHRSLLSKAEIARRVAILEEVQEMVAQQAERAWAAGSAERDARWKNAKTEEERREASRKNLEEERAVWREYNAIRDKLIHYDPF